MSAPEVAHAFYEVLRARGVTRIFGNPGSNELTMLKHLPDDIHYVLALQEGAAVAMADGYAQASGSLGVVNLHSSSGTGNAMGNLTNSAAAHAPVLVIAGQQNRRYVPMNAMLTNVEASRLADPLVKWSAEPLRPEDVPALVSQAALLAMSAPTGPTYVSIPLDDWAHPADDRVSGALSERSVSASPVLPETSIDEIVAEVDAASSPALVLGPGVDTEAGWRATRSLSERRGLPVWVAPSPSRAPFPTRHPHFRGILPTGLGAVADLLSEHDLVLSLGAAVFRYHQFVDGAPLREGTRLIAITSDPGEAARAAAGAIHVGDPADAAARLTARVRAGDRPAGHGFAPDAAPASVNGRHSAQAILDAVDRAKRDDAVVVLEWTSADALWARLSFDRAQSYYFPANGGLGWGLPAAIGVQLADPTRPVIALIGDGAMQYTPAALWTAARYGIPVTFVIGQNEEYGALQRFSRIMDVPDGGYLDLAGLDPCAIARGYGVEAHRFEELDQLEQFIREAGHATGPRLAVIPQSSQR
ncbi:benzoylformate decarboxylase [Microbacterium sp.]|uniref:benzoylformate decarboxylase n=1 Tax=Microbacterium sp. TaxID=51671 RepID=UPI000925C7E8|nr:benzoylformate decarboxylase [Microbacterium sp.]MBN9194087.1 benzoylformate decarboxylase [Microbacterium sp.]OJU59892.1 MAG: benzoylformate decarboxylase [Microbacterium sp. 70-38]